MSVSLKAIFKKYTKRQYVYVALLILYCLYVYLSGNPINILWLAIIGTIIIHVLTKNRYLEIFSRFLVYLFIILNIIWFIQGLSFYSWALSQPSASIYNNHLFLFLARNCLFFLILIFAIIVNKPINRFQFSGLISKIKKN